MFFKIKNCNRVFNDKNISNLKVCGFLFSTVKNIPVGIGISFQFHGITYTGDLFSKKYCLESYIKKGMKGVQYINNKQQISTQLYEWKRNRKTRRYYIIDTNNHIVGLRKLKNFMLHCERWDKNGALYTYLIYED